MAGEFLQPRYANVFDCSLCKRRQVERLAEGTELTELRRRDGWINVRHFPSGKEGWTRAASIVAHRPSEPEQRQEKPKPPAVSTGLPDAA